MLLFFSLIPAAFGFTPHDLRSGDVLLQSVQCFVCSMIEFEEGAPYSHAGLVVANEGTDATVLESWVKIEMIPVQKFLSKRKSNTTTLVMRPVNQQGEPISISHNGLLHIFQKDFFGKHYDEAFLWDNTDELGEKYYCSEFVAKLLNRFLPIPIDPKPMHFNQYRSYWVQYFHGNPPDQKPGLAPSDFAKSSLFKKMGELN